MSTEPIRQEYLADYLAGTASEETTRMIENHAKRDKEFAARLNLMASAMGPRILPQDTGSRQPPEDAPTPVGGQPILSSRNVPADVGRAIPRALSPTASHGSGTEVTPVPGDSEFEELVSFSDEFESPRSDIQHAIHGVLVGVDFYSSANPDFASPLSCAVHDVEGANRVFMLSHQNTYLRPLLNQDATVSGIRQEVEAVAKAVSRDDTFLFLFCGHGWRVKRDGQWEAAFLTSEFRSMEDTTESGLPIGVFTLGDLKRWLGNAAPKNIIVLLSSCYSSVSPPGERSRADDTARFDKYTAVPQSVATEVETEEEIELDLASSEWPAKSNVAVVTAAKDWQLAYEVPDVGHGVFTLLVLEWWQNQLAANRGATDDFGRELERYVKEQTSRLEGMFQGRIINTPGSYYRGVVRFDDPGNWSSAQPSLNWITINRMLRSTGVYDAWTHVLPPDVFEKAVSSILDAVVEQADDPATSNLVVKVPRLSGSQPVLNAVAERLETYYEHDGRPVLCVELGYFQEVLPLMIALGLYPESYQGYYPRAAQPPLLRQSAPETGFAQETIDFFVESLKERRAILITVYREEETEGLAQGAPDALYFVKCCAQAKEIPLCLVEYTDEHGPSFLHDTDYRTIFPIEYFPLDAIEVAAEHEAPPVDLDRIPDDLRSRRLLDWLGLLKQSELTLVQRNPYDAGKNIVRTYTCVIQDVLAQLERTKHGRAAIRLLALMSIIDLPRNERLVGQFWRKLRAENLTSTTRLEDVIGTLRHYYFIEPAIRDEDKHGADYHLVHFLVRKAVSQYILDLSRPKLPDEPSGGLSSREARLRNQTRQLHLLAGRAFRTMLEDNQHDPIWRTEMVAYKAIDHFCQAGAYEDAAKMLGRYWDELVDFGYCRAMLNWLTDLKGRTTAKSELRLLFHEISLRKHLQQWEMIPALVREFKKRYFIPPHDGQSKQVRPDFRDAGKLDEELEELLWSVRRHKAHYYFLHNRFDEARSLYDECLAWNASRHGEAAVLFRCECLIRKARCDVHEGRFKDADAQFANVKAAMNDLPNSKRRGVRKKLNSVIIDYCRILEDWEKLNKKAWKNWRSSLEATKDQRFSRAIANIQVAWAALFRGECLRAWRRALHARQLLISRGVLEYWWIADAERIAGLATAWMFARRDPTALIEPWIENVQPEREEAKRIVRDELPQQRRHMELLAARLRYSNPWRAAELHSACGQMLAYTGEDATAGRRHLQMALDIAEENGYRVLLMYIHEALASLAPNRRECLDHMTASIQIAKELGIHDSSPRRRRNLQQIKLLEELAED